MTTRTPPNLFAYCAPDPGPCREAPVSESKLAIGSATDTGYYYDFDSAVSFTPELLENRSEMAKICMENLKIERFELPCAEALALMKDEPYKSELLNESKTPSFLHRQGDFTDQCRAA